MGRRIRAEELRLELYKKINALGIGAQGLGGLTTVLDVKVKDYPTHAANLPVAMIPNCAATRHAHFVLDGSGPVALEPPSLERLAEADLRSGWRAPREPRHRHARGSGDLEARRSAAAQRQAAHRPRCRAQAHDREADRKGEQLPVDFTNRFIYYVGPVDPVRDEVVGPAGPTTATRMDKFTRQMLKETGLLGMVGKSERGPAAIEAIRDHKAVYLMAVGGAAYLVSKAIKKSRVLALPRSRHGSHLRIRGAGHAGHGRGGRQRQLGARERPEGVAGQDRGAGGDRLRTDLTGNSSRWRRRSATFEIVAACANLSAGTPSSIHPGDCV